MYYRHDTKKLARQRQLDHEKKNITLVQQKLHSFTGLTTALHKITRDRYYEIDNIDDAMGFSAIDIARSSTLNEDSELRNTFQKTCHD